MIDQSQWMLILNIFFVCVVLFFVRRMLRASSIFNWNPGDGEVQQRQKIIILKSIIVIATVALLAALVNAFFG